MGQSAVLYAADMGRRLNRSRQGGFRAVLYAAPVLHRAHLLHRRSTSTGHQYVAERDHSDNLPAELRCAPVIVARVLRMRPGRGETSATGSTRTEAWRAVIVGFAAARAAMICLFTGLPKCLSSRGRHTGRRCRCAWSCLPFCWVLTGERFLETLSLLGQCRCYG